jgi:hypothetical protein
LTVRPVVVSLSVVAVLSVVVVVVVPVAVCTRCRCRRSGGRYRAPRSGAGVSHVVVVASTDVSCLGCLAVAKSRYRCRW